MISLGRRQIDREAVLRAYHVSRETTERLDRLVIELGRWQKVKNLVGPSALTNIWQRHIADSLQLQNLRPEPGVWLDIGSGGGFPGLVIAMVRTELSLGPVHLVESNGRKCAFLRHVIDQCKLDAIVHEGRVEQVLPALSFGVETVSARAVASLSQLIDWCNGLLRNGTVGLFPKGQDVEIEIQEASTSWDFRAELHQSLTDPGGRIILVRMLATEGESHGSRHFDQ